MGPAFSRKTLQRYCFCANRARVFSNKCVLGCYLFWEMGFRRLFSALSGSNSRQTSAWVQLVGRQWLMPKASSKSHLSALLHPVYWTYRECLHWEQNFILLLRVNYYVLMTTCYLALRAVGNCVLVTTCWRGVWGIGSHEGFRLALMLPRLAMHDVLRHRTWRILRWFHRCQCFCNTR